MKADSLLVLLEIWLAIVAIAIILVVANDASGGAIGALVSHWIGAIR